MGLAREEREGWKQFLGLGGDRGGGDGKWGGWGESFNRTKFGTGNTARISLKQLRKGKRRN